jgi:UDP-N-acetylmuramoyl-L-alanyl-D-glutamate--2,6-diaminopimelate ligase
LRLTDLLGDAAAGGGCASIDAGARVIGLTADSREVKPGFLFAALPGQRADGRRFVDDAVRRGAVAIVMPPDCDTLGNTTTPAANGARDRVTVIVDDNPRRRFALLAARFYGRQPKTIAAVTGTNGKTSVTWFLRQMWESAGHPAANLGTLGLSTRDRFEPGSLTTPDPVTLHRLLARLAEAGVDHLAMEASSHGLAQYRLDGVRVAAAAFTNLTRDHLDFHGSAEAYRAAKRRLFVDLLSADGGAVINADSADARAMVEGMPTGVRHISFGTAGRDIRLHGIEPVAGGQRISVTAFGDRWTATVPLVGDFQISNALCALGLAVATGVDPATARDALTSLQPVPGRLQQVFTGPGGALGYVDYAHTPDALAAALSALRPLAGGRLVVVFGCGGDRDAGKRVEMGRIAASLADRVIVTDDNPRGEDAAAIRASIRAGCPDASEIGDRAAAIRAGIVDLGPGDVLLVAGKGHETGQIVGDRVLPFDDALVVGEAAREVFG